MVFLKNSKQAETSIEQRDFWNMVKSIFRVVPWNPKFSLCKVLIRSVPRWVEIKNVPRQLWAFISHASKSVGEVFQVENTRATLPQMNARILLVVSLENPIPYIICFQIENKSM